MSSVDLGNLLFLSVVVNVLLATALSVYVKWCGIYKQRWFELKAANAEKEIDVELYDPPFVVNRECEIKEMEVGTYGWAVPWGAYVCESGVYLNGNYMVFPEPGGTFKMKVRREQDGYYYIDFPADEVMKKMKGTWGEPIRVCNIVTCKQKLNELSMITEELP